MKRFLGSTVTFAAISLLCFSTSGYAGPLNGDCKDLPPHLALKKALTEARQQDNGGLNLDMWGAVVDRSGIVCAVVFTGEKVDSQWPASRVIAAQKANTANGFSLKNAVLSTANLYAGTQPGGFLFGLQESNPINLPAAYKGEAKDFGSPKDPMVGDRIGGINVFGGGLALYNAKNEIVGALGVSGDTSCADHNIAWRTRNKLELDYVPATGVAADKSDQIIYDISDGESSSGFGHPTCVGKEDSIAKDLPKVRKAS